MPGKTMRNQLTDQGAGSSLLCTRHGACQRGGSHKSILFRYLFDMQCRQRPALRAGVPMSSLIGFSRLVLILFLACSSLMAQTAAPRILTLDEAVELAVKNNLSLRIATLEIEKSKWEVAELKTKRLPAMNTTVFASQLLNEISFTFKEGAFGNY